MNELDGTAERQRRGIRATKVGVGLADDRDHRTDPDPPVNLREPADGPDGHDFGAHGAFDDKR